VKIAIVSLPVTGHLNPMSALAAKLQSRGHEIVFISVPDAEARAVAAGLRFITVAADLLPLGITSEVEKQFSVTKGEEGLKYTFDLMGVVTGALLRPVEEVLRAERPDGVVFDSYQPYLELAAIANNLPYIHVSASVPIDVTGNTPLCFFAWDHVETTEARERNCSGVSAYRKFLEPSLVVAQQYAGEKGLVINWDDLTATRSKLAWITQLPASLDFAPFVADEALTHTGPFTDERLRPHVEFPWERLSDLPLVYASMGTLQNGIEDVFRDIVQAASQLTGLQFVVAVGNKLDQTIFDPVPPNVVLVGTAPQLELLKRASLCVTHGGLNTVLESLTNGVPLVAIPITNDQPGVATRILAVGVGASLNLTESSPARLRALIEEVLLDPKYREKAQEIANSIAEHNGLTQASAKIEAAFSHPSTRAASAAYEHVRHIN
jgi:zeaxanthin glucosyltransferase